MNKSMLYAGLMTILSTAIYAENNNQSIDNVATAIQAAASSQVATSSATSGATQQPQVVASQATTTPSSQTQPTTPLPSPKPEGTQATQPSTTQDATSTTTPSSSGQTTPSNTTTPSSTTTPSGTTTPSTTSTPSTSTTTPQTTQTTTQTASQQIDCNYRIPASTSKVDQDLVMKWSEKATAQSFDFDYTTMDQQLAALKACFTDLGWQGFNDALQKSGNLSAIKSQQLMVSSMVNGTGQISEVKENQWKVSLPLQVVYQNDKEKLTQSLTINLVVGRKVSGDLGIMQMIAIPRNTTNKNSSQTTSTSNVSSSSTQPSEQH